MLEALRAYLQGLGYEPVYLDYLPDTPESAIGLFSWGDDMGAARDGTATRYLQVRVRGPDPTAVRACCVELGELLDSGIDERRIPLVCAGAVIGTLRRGPLLIARTKTTVTYYIELALWGLREN